MKIKNKNLIVLTVISITTLGLFQNATLSAPLASGTVYKTLPIEISSALAGPYLDKKGAGISIASERENRDYSLINAKVQAWKLKKLKAKWYYTWGLDPLTLPLDSNKFTPADQLKFQKNFVPMVWGSGTNSLYDSCNDEVVNDILVKGQASLKNMQALQKSAGLTPSKFSNILLYNEPNGVDQSNMSPKLAADCFVKSYNGLRDLTEGFVTPVPAGGIKSTWINDFFYEMKALKKENFSSEKVFKNLAYHNYPNPVSKDRKSLISPEALAQQFLNNVQSAHRLHKLPIWITEFGVADWDSTNCYDKKKKRVIAGCSVISNLIPEAFVKRFLEIVLPELYSRTYIARFAYFSNQIDYNEELKSSAIFKFKQSEELTSLGKFYANYVPVSNCQKGEYANSDGSFVEWETVNCNGHSSADWKQISANVFAKNLKEVIAPVVNQPAPVSAIDVFNEACYLKRYPDVISGWVKRGGKAIDHWNRYGKNEKRIPGCSN